MSNPHDEPWRYVDDDWEYEVVVDAGQFAIQFPTGHMITDPQQVIAFIKSTPRAEEYVMSIITAEDLASERDDYNPMDVISGNLASAEAWVAAHTPGSTPVEQLIGANAKTIAAAERVGRAWANVDKANRVKSVTLDTDPEIPGRPVSQRPGVPQVLLIEVPEWWYPDRKTRSGEMFEVYYLPTSSYTFTATDFDDLGRPSTRQVTLASKHDPAGYVAVLRTITINSLAEAQEWEQAGREAVKTIAMGSSGAGYVLDETDEERAERLAEQAAADMRALMRS